MKSPRYYGYASDKRLIKAGVRVILSDGLTYIITFRMDDGISVYRKGAYKNVNVSDIKTILHSSYVDESFR